MYLAQLLKRCLSTSTSKGLKCFKKLVILLHKCVVHYPGARKTRKVILFLYSTPVSSHLQCCVQLPSPQHSRDMDLLERVHRRPQK